MPAVAFPDVSKQNATPELADVFRQYGQSFLSTRRIPLRHLKVMRQIVNCRTEVLGGHRQWCAHCGYQRFLYHSCRNRHCPKCQSTAKEAWREARQLDLLPIPYFHNVFTLPHELNSILLKCEANQRAVLRLLFDAAARTLTKFGDQEMGGQVGFTMVLHTWDQQLRPHFHLHCLIASGALSRDRSRWIAGGNRFLFSVRALSKVYRGKFLDGLEELFANNALVLDDTLNSTEKRRRFIKQLAKKSWVIYSKPPFASPAKLLDYLSRYTHRVAITNSRLKRCENGEVTMTYRDRRDGDRRKLMTIPAAQFIGRFLTHVLPDGFMRIRHYGFLANRNRKRNLEIIRRLIGAKPNSQVPSDSNPIAEWLEQIKKEFETSCPCCGERLLEAELPVRTVDSSIARFSTVLRNSPKRGPP